MQPSDWYLVTQKDFHRAGGRALFNHHASLESALKVAYPEYPWDPQRFPTPHGYWRDINNQRMELERIGRQLGVKEVQSPPLCVEYFFSLWNLCEILMCACSVMDCADVRFVLCCFCFCSF